MRVLGGAISLSPSLSYGHIHTHTRTRNVDTILVLVGAKPWRRRRQRLGDEGGAGRGEEAPFNVILLNNSCVGETIDIK